MSERKLRGRKKIEERVGGGREGDRRLRIERRKKRGEKKIEE